VAQEGGFLSPTGTKMPTDLDICPRSKHRFYCPVLTIPVTVSSICLSDNPSSDCDFSLPNSTEQVSARNWIPAGGSCSERTVSGVDLGQGPLRLADEDGNLRIVLLHGRIGARKERSKKCIPGRQYFPLPPQERGRPVDRRSAVMPAGTIQVAQSKASDSNERRREKNVPHGSALL
jgi:hypothetical protein